MMQLAFAILFPKMRK